MDMRIEFDYVTSEGAGTVLDAFGEWPAHEFRPITSGQWNSVITRIKGKELKIKDLVGTDLEAFVKYIKEYPRNKFTALYDTFSCLVDIEAVPDKNFYCLYDRGAWEDTPMFFTDLESLKEAFYNAYCENCTPWEEMTDTELEYWYERINDEFNTFPLNSYDNLSQNLCVP
jgi:hypothetical protein